MTSRLDPHHVIPRTLGADLQRQGLSRKRQCRPSPSPVVSLRGSHPAVFLAFPILAGMDETENLDLSCSRADAVGDQEWRSRDA